ncbi:AAA family ATPase [Xanthomonas rydalmerensis]|uniref:AAA family ATPase n=1 Tax=Xanthomonas rydalmerensis TaxID=3046274 RepID=A0ABZ0JNH8_9XANT|nr:AAA family ATPase [Xanthomonas sp. DM-2023]WOS40548.1 AAA family ATPase [Xanthomonas sp. DM-2023]WOS44732.1 AAA family ATPase [Xanthomonas sp. DM-2023]WOS48912.1 AAA family ATPase [Xanthomonas sp. DM-2023]WOS53092.1 AAA family ATPase [Xanthomonas sp. DM-2023]WOS57275.1 AAA family ATPase [Xanthomonas sp. DM-2023]
MLTTLAVSSYRSLRELVLPLAGLTLITGANGSGKSNVYRALRLLADTAQGGVIAALAREGGLPSALWAGPETLSRAVRRGEHPVEGTVRQQAVGLKLGYASDAFGYAIDLGLPMPSASAFGLDPQIKRECIWAGPWLRQSNLLVDRNGPAVRLRTQDDGWTDAGAGIASFDSVLAQFSDPRAAPEMHQVRENIRRWRFYDHFRTDAAAPARMAQIGTHTPVLSNDGADLAAAIQTILEIGDADGLHAAVDDAFPGARLTIEVHAGRFDLAMHQHGLLRPLSAAELSDGTLRYLLWIAALLSPRPPELLVLNEPEASLHPDLLPALARLIGSAARQAQIIVVSHASRLIAALEQQPDCLHHLLIKEHGQTDVAGLRALDRPAWHWPSR